MRDIKKPSQIRIRISDEDQEVLSRLTDDVLSITDVATYLLHGACIAIRENNGKISIPPRFLVSDSPGFTAGLNLKIPQKRA